MFYLDLFLFLVIMMKYSFGFDNEKEMLEYVDSLRNMFYGRLYEYPDNRLKEDNLLYRFVLRTDDRNLLYGTTYWDVKVYILDDGYIYGYHVILERIDDIELKKNIDSCLYEKKGV